MIMAFNLRSKYQPSGDQPDAIAKLASGIEAGVREQTLLGVTGSGKTFTMANLIAKRNKPTLILSHNKTLAAQLYGEFKEFFPDNAVHYFVSYFDYYQPEAYIPRSDTYIEKDSAISEEIDRLRLAATRSLLTRKDVIIIASVSCIYGIGSVDDFQNMSISVSVGEIKRRDKFLRLMTDIQYTRNDQNFVRGTFRVRGEYVDVFPADGEEAYRIQFFGDEVESIAKLAPLTGEVLERPNAITIFPAKHHVAPKDQIKHAIDLIQAEATERIAWFKSQEMHLEAQRLEQRIKYDCEILDQTGYVKGIENYSRYLTNREPGEQPATLLDYFPDDFLMLIDESHITVPQVRGMYNGDRARKEILVQYGFRLPSALDNRPLRFEEFDRHINQVVYVSATPSEYELSESGDHIAEQIIRPTGLLDPEIEVCPAEHQVDDLIAEVRVRIQKGQRALVTTLTKRMAEDLTEYLQDIGIRVQYLHSDVNTLERTDILRDLRLGVYDVLVGINLLREGLDLPEVSLVAIIDADKEGFLRSESSLIQTIGRAARHVEGKVIMYADTITSSMKAAIDETNRRRGKQRAYNEAHGITPQGIQKAIAERMAEEREAELADVSELQLDKIPKDELRHLVKQLTEQMDLAAANLQFEKAAELRDQLADIRDFQAGKKIGKK
ncbi:excinuclease ABC subunit UvrB [bacterium]|nr:excinuclease ABC subunit UvrB [bacterium]